MRERGFTEKKLDRSELPKDAVLGMAITVARAVL